MKNYCPTHHFYYDSMECPLCSKERLEALSKKYTDTVNHTETRDNAAITQKDIDRLCAKFNSKS